MARDESPSISLRLPRLVYRALVEEARMLATTPGRHAKRLLIERLDDHDALEIRRYLDEHRVELALLRHDVATVIEALLLNLPQRPFTRDQVAEFVTRKLRRPEGTRGA